MCVLILSMIIYIIFNMQLHRTDFKRDRFDILWIKYVEIKKLKI